MNLNSYMGPCPPLEPPYMGGAPTVNRLFCNFVAVRRLRPLITYPNFAAFGLRRGFLPMA